MMGPGFMPDYMGWMMLGSSLFWVALIALAAFVIYRLTRMDGRRSDARALLDQRLARGEIDAEEYQTRLAALQG